MTIHHPDACLRSFEPRVSGVLTSSFATDRCVLAEAEGATSLLPGPCDEVAVTRRGPATGMRDKHHDREATPLRLGAQLGTASQGNALAAECDESAHGAKKRDGKTADDEGFVPSCRTHTTRPLCATSTPIRSIGRVRLPGFSCSLAPTN